MRILVGEFKGRKLLGPPGKDVTRPITGRAKKSLFDALGAGLMDATVLDLYCGTGTLGLEALSRGAARCFFAERDRAALVKLRRNIEALGACHRCEIWPGDVLERLQQLLSAMDGPVGVAFVDPPYAHARRWDWSAVQARLFEPLAARLAADGLVVLRTPKALKVPEQLGALAIWRSRRYGDMAVTMYELPEQAAPSELAE